MGRMNALRSECGMKGYKCKSTRDGRICSEQKKVEKEKQLENDSKWIRK